MIPDIGLLIHGPQIFIQLGLLSIEPIPVCRFKSHLPSLLYHLCLFHQSTSLVLE